MVSVGVIGAGQLARMMISPAVELGMDLKVFAEADQSSAKLAATKVGDYTDYQQLIEFARTVDVITFDHEHVPTKLLEQLQSEGILVRPGPGALIHAQNKLVMRRRLQELGLPQPSWRAAKNESEIAEFLAEHGPQIVVKTPIGGYDGKGVRVISSVGEVQDWLSEIDSFGGELLLEQKVAFVRELAQLSARRPAGEFRTWPLVETRQKNSVCSEVIAPAKNGNQEKTNWIAKTIAEGLDVTGVMAVEMFETASGEIFVNELAMRPHNSGHFSIEGSKTSQFEQHLRAVLDLPLGSTDMTSACAVMINLLGVDSENDFVSRYAKTMAVFPDIHFHSYQKGPRAGRKIGHLTLLGQSEAELIERGLQARSMLTDGKA